jgi:hypothetical protein
VSAVRAWAWAALAALGAGALSCAPPLDPAAIAAVEIVSRVEPPAACRGLGPVEGKDSNRWVPNGPSYEAALVDLRRKAVSGGGNHLVIDALSPPDAQDYMPTFTIQARLFACPAARAGSLALAPPPPSAGAASARVCEPDCSPGYTCLRGVCVSACNPLCAVGERCGADRICRLDTVPSSPAPVPGSGTR